MEEYGPYLRALRLAWSCLPPTPSPCPRRNAPLSGDIPKDERIAGCTTLLELNKYGLKAEIIGHFIRARTSFHKGDFDGAIADYTEIIRLNPKNEYAYLERGVTYFNKHDFDLAIADYDRAIELN